MLLDKIKIILRRYKILPIYWAFLTYMLLKSGQQEKNSFLEIVLKIPDADKIIHWAVFALLGFLFMMRFSKIRIWLFGAIMLFYACLTEVLQELMGLGRTMEFNDIVADMLGVMIGYFVAIRVDR